MPLAGGPEGMNDSLALFSFQVSSNAFPLKGFISEGPVARIPKRRGSYMARQNTKTNEGLLELISDLKAQTRSTGSALWRDVAQRLEKSRSNWAEPNLSRLERHMPEDAVVLVPGKLLGSGLVSGKRTVAAYNVSSGARVKIEKAGGRVISIRELMNENPKGTGVHILG